MPYLRNFAFFLESKIPSQKKTDKISDFSDLGILPPSWTWKEIEKAYRELMKEVDWDDIIDLNFTPDPATKDLKDIYQVEALLEKEHLTFFD
jgi:hypothetical protein